MSFEWVDAFILLFLGAIIFFIERVVKNQPEPPNEFEYFKTKPEFKIHIPKPEDIIIPGTSEQLADQLKETDDNFKDPKKWLESK